MWQLQVVEKMKKRLKMVKVEPLYGFVAFYECIRG